MYTKGDEPMHPGQPAGELVGLLPAAGRGSRLGAIPSSKEIMPLGFHPVDDGESARWKPFTTMEAHLRAHAQAGIRRTIIVLGRNKYDIMDYLGSGERYGLKLSYLFQEALRGMPFALDLARPWAASATTMFSMPDTLIEPTESFALLARHHEARQADVTLGLFPTDNPSKFGMVDIGADGRINRFVDKPKQTRLTLMWGLAVWSPRFAGFMHEYLAHVPADAKETVLSDVFQAAVDAGLHVEPLRLDGASYSDVGTPEEFQGVVQSLATR